MKRVMLLAIGAALLLLPAAPAVAQTTGTTVYPPGNCAVENSTQNLGVVQIGGSVTGTLTPSPCPFVPGSTESVSVNGTPAGTKAANGGGGVFVSIQVTSATSGLLNDPVTVPLHCGSNSVSVTGPTLSGPSAFNVGTFAGGPTSSSQATVTGLFTVVCPGAAGAVPSGVGGAAAGAVGGRVAFTGANILRWSMAAAALIAVGVLFLLGSRRRRSSLGA